MKDDDWETIEEINRLEESERMLNELLAVIHRDGGHYQSEHGLQKAYKDAKLISSNRISKIQELEEQVLYLTGKLP